MWASAAPGAACALQVFLCSSDPQPSSTDRIPLPGLRAPVLEPRPRYATRFMELCAMLCSPCLPTHAPPTVAATPPPATHTHTRYATRFMEMCVMLCADHGPCVSGAHNAIVTSRAGKDLVSCLVSGLLTIGPRFGGAIDDAARCFKASGRKRAARAARLEGLCAPPCVALPPAGGRMRASLEASTGVSTAAAAGYTGARRCCSPSLCAPTPRAESPCRVQTPAPARGGGKGLTRQDFLEGLRRVGRPNPHASTPHPLCACIRRRPWRRV